MNAITTTGGNSLVPTNMEGAMRLAEMMARGKLVPQHLHNSPGDCLMIIEQAMRWGMSPFAVAQSTSVIQGKLMFEGKLVSAALHSSGIMSSRLDYEFSGEGEARAVVARGTLRGEDKPREIRVALKEAKTSNGMWTKQPDQQLVYFATRAWARRHAPEVMLGVYSPEEFDAPAPAQPDTFAGPTIEAKPEPQPTMGEQIGDGLPAHSAPVKRTVGHAIDELEIEFAKSETRDEVDAVLASDKCQKTLDYARNGAKERLQSIVAAALKRTEDQGKPAQTTLLDASDDPEMDAAAELRGMVMHLPDTAAVEQFAAQHRKTMLDWKKRRPELFESVDSAIAERQLDLTPTE